MDGYWYMVEVGIYRVLHRHLTVAVQEGVCNRVIGLQEGVQEGVRVGV